MAKQKQFKFNIKNLKYKNANGEWKNMSYATSLTLDANFAEKNIYGDGELIASIPNDKGFTGTIGVTDLDLNYEVFLGRKIKTADGITDVAQRKQVVHDLYYEIDAFIDGEKVTIKNWLYNCVVGKPSEAYAQTEDDINITAFELPLTVMGKIELTEEEVEYKVFRTTKYPDDAEYNIQQYKAIFRNEQCLGGTAVFGGHEILAGEEGNFYNISYDNSDVLNNGIASLEIKDGLFIFTVNISDEDLLVPGNNELNLMDNDNLSSGKVSATYRITKNGVIYDFSGIPSSQYEDAWELKPVITKIE